MKTLERFSPKASAVIPNWVDVGRFNYRSHPVRDPVNIGLLGQISPHKGHDEAIEAMRELRIGYRLVVAGRGENAYVESLKRKAVGLPVEFPGLVSLPNFFDSVDMLVVPSWEEPFGIVLLEAMAVGIPVIATDRGGPLEIIRSGFHGLLVPPRQPRALANAIRQLAHDEPLRQRIVREARTRVEENYDISKVVPRVEDFYRKVIFGSG
jgi:type III pantothenate kinase